MLHVAVFPAIDFDDQLVEGVIIAPPREDRIPADTLADAAGNAGMLSLLLICLFLVVIFHLQEILMQLQMGKRRDKLILHRQYVISLGVQR